MSEAPQVHPQAVDGVRAAAAAHALGGFLNAVEEAVKPYGAAECVPSEVPRACAAVQDLLEALGLASGLDPADPLYRPRLARRAEVWADRVSPTPGGER